MLWDYFAISPDVSLNLYALNMTTNDTLFYDSLTVGAYRWYRWCCGAFSAVQQDPALQRYSKPLLNATLTGPVGCWAPCGPRGRVQLLTHPHRHQLRPQLGGGDRCVCVTAFKVFAQPWPADRLTCQPCRNLAALVTRTRLHCFLLGCSLTARKNTPQTPDCRRFGLQDGCARS